MIRCAKCNEFPAADDEVCCSLCLWLRDNQIVSTGNSVLLANIEASLGISREKDDKIFANVVKKVGRFRIVTHKDLYDVIMSGKLSKYPRKKKQLTVT